MRLKTKADPGTTKKYRTYDKEDSAGFATKSVQAEMPKRPLTRAGSRDMQLEIATTKKYRSHENNAGCATERQKCG